MKRLLLVSLFTLILSASFAQIPPEWKNRWWEGVLEEASLPINLCMQNLFSEWKTKNAESTENALNIIKQMTGQSGDHLLTDLYPVLYSPMQTPQPFQADDDFSFVNDTLRLSIPGLGVKMTLVYSHKDSTFTGTFRQGMSRFDIRLTPCDTMTTFNRPQTPEPPYAFRAEQVVVKHKDKKGNEVELAGTLAIPTIAASGEKGYPAVVLVSGSGQQNRDEEVYLHKPFLILANELAKQGIATLRYDDRGVGGSKGEVATATTWDFADDAEAMFNYLRKRPEVDSRQVGILGHSEGGAIAPIIAARNRKVAFVVMMAGPGYSGSEVLIQQNGAIMRAQGVDERLCKIRMECIKEIFSIASATPDEEMQKKVASIIDRHAASLTKEEQKQISLRHTDSYVWAQQLNHPWIRAFLQIDPATYLPKVKCPILALNGVLDCQVTAENIERINMLCLNNKNVQTGLLAGLNHFFQKCTTGSPSESLFIEQTIDPEVPERIAGFILSISRK